jgi:signal peptidase I
MSIASRTGVAAASAAAALALVAAACGGDNDAAARTGQDTLALTTEAVESDRGTELLGLAVQVFAEGDLSGTPELAKALRTGEAKPWDNATLGMSPTLLPDDRVLAWNWAYRGARIRRGDVVAFRPTRSAQRICSGPPGTVFIKRVVGLPGDRVVATRREVRVNGRPQIVKGAAAPGYSMSWPKLGPGRLVLLGDNRPNSCDSRLFGPQPASRILGKVVGIYLPVDRVGVLLRHGGSAPAPGS